MDPRELNDKLAGVGKSKPSQTAVEFVVNAIKQLIIGGDLLPGDRLPSENEMTKLLMSRPFPTGPAGCFPRTKKRVVLSVLSWMFRTCTGT